MAPVQEAKGTLVEFSNRFELAVQRLLSGPILLLIAVTNLGAATYHLDCTSGEDEADGLSAATAWRTLTAVNHHEFKPGDSILLRRGMRCPGSLSPKGSGEQGRPIRLGAYGTGALPVVEAGAAEAAITLQDQQYWEIENLETTGGNHYGVHIHGTKTEAARTLRHLHLRNLVVHDVTGVVKEKASGLVVIAAPDGVTFEDVLVDGVTAYNTTQWAGILITGSRNRVRGAVVRNSIVHDVFGDGIVMFLVEDGTIEKSAAWLTGLQPTETIGTPSAIWTWTCRNCVVQHNEGFWTDSPGVDGGVYDIDWGNDDNTVQYNYAHDAQGYCVSVFGAGWKVTTNSVVRYNVCVNNGRSPKLARRQGDVYLSTWDGGALDGVLVYNNTIFWNPPIDAPAVHVSETEFRGTRPNRFFNNVICSTVPSMAVSGGKIHFERNLYWHSGSAAPNWSYAGRDYAGFHAYRDALPDERSADPRFDWRLSPLAGSPLITAGLPFGNGGTRDAFGAPNTAGVAPQIGAIQVQPAPSPAGKAPAALQRREGRWTLLLAAGKAGAGARSQLVFVQAALAQYGDRKLDAIVAADADANLQYDWNLSSARLLTGPNVQRELGIRSAPALLLISPAGEIVRRWDGFAAPAELGLTLKHYLGPAGGQAGIDLTPPAGGDAR